MREAVEAMAARAAEKVAKVAKVEATVEVEGTAAAEMIDNHIRGHPRDCVLA